MRKLKYVKMFEDYSDGTYSKAEIISAWAKCKDNKGRGYVAYSQETVVTLQDLLSELENSKLNISDVSSSYSKDVIEAAWTNCIENRGRGYVVTLQDLLSELV